MRRAAVTAVAVALIASACGRATASIGPLSIDIPQGWQVASIISGNLKLTDGTIADENATQPGTAKAVFDVYVPSSQTLENFVNYLKEQHVAPQRRDLKVGGHDAVLLSYVGAPVGGHQEALFVPDRRVFILYRAAKAGDDLSFFRKRAAFRAAVRSIHFDAGPA